MNLYHILFKIFITFPILGIINSFLFKKYYKTQKFFNNIIYLCLILLNILIFIYYIKYGSYNLYLFYISKGIPIIFSINSFNLISVFILVISIFFLNDTFQNYFNLLEIPEKYILYNKQMSFLYYIYILFILSSNIVINIYLFMLIMFFSYYLIINPDLVEFRKRYSLNFSLTISINIILFILSTIFFTKSNNILFFFVKKTYDIQQYWIIIIFFILIYINFIYPVYSIFKENFYYEDFLPVFIIIFFPFIFLNTFFFTKIIIYIFNINKISTYFFYIGISIILLFLIACYFTLKYIKNNIKFILNFLFLNFLVYLSRFLFSISYEEMINTYVNFLLLFMSSILIILCYSSVLFILLSANITNINLFYKRYKMELNFFMFCLAFPLIIINYISYFSLNFYNFNILYLINLIELIILTIIYFVFLYFFLQKKKEKSKSMKISELNRFKLNLSPILFFLLIVIFIIFQDNITDFIITYKTF